MASDVQIEVEGKPYAVRVERHIVSSMRDVMATAWAGGHPVAQHEMTTSAARGYLHRDTSAEPPTWTELEEIALDMLKLQLEDLEE